MGMVSPLKSSGGDFEVIPEGMHSAVCDIIADVGVQPGGKFKPSPKLVIRWLTPDNLLDLPGGEKRPMAIANSFTYSVNKKSNLRKLVEGWRGKAFSDEEADQFDFSALLGKPCLVQVMHRKAADGKTYADVKSVVSLPKGMPVPTLPQGWKTICYYPGLDDVARAEAYGALPEWIRKKIDSQLQAESASAPGGSDDTVADDDIPF